MICLPYGQKASSSLLLIHAALKHDIFPQNHSVCEINANAALNQAIYASRNKVEKERSKVTFE